VTRRLSTTLACVALVAAWAAAPASASPVLRVDGARATRVDDPYLPPRAQTELPPPSGSAVARVRAAQSGPSVYAVLDAAVAAGTVTADDATAYREIYDSARQARGGLPGPRRTQLSNVISTLERISRRGQLVPERLAPLFLQLERNLEFWRSNDVPPAGTRVVFKGSPVVFQAYPGQGLQLQPLGNFGKANALWTACTDSNPKLPPCDRAELRSLLDWMLAVAGRRGDFTAWEYFFTFGGGTPPWTSGLSQGTAVQAMARGGALLGDPAYTEAARAGLGAFETAPPLGVRVRSSGGAHYLIYSFDPHMRVLNGFLQAVTGLYDVAKITGDPRAQALFVAGDRAARREVPHYDTGTWSRYSLGGSRSDIGYHRLVRDFLGNLCERTRTPVYCRTEARFTRYLHNPENVRKYAGPKRTSAKKPTDLKAPLAGPVRVVLRIEDGRRRLRFEPAGGG
jgi:hypothetical protein